MFYCLGYVHETSPGTHTLFPSYTHFITTSYISVQLSDFGLYSNLVHAVSLKCNKPEFCLVLSSDSISRWTPLALAVSFPLPGGFGDFHPLERVPTGHTINKEVSPGKGHFFWWLFVILVYGCLTCSV